MQRFLIAIGVVVVVAAAILGFLLYGGEEPAAPVAKQEAPAAEPATATSETATSDTATSDTTASETPAASSQAAAPPAPPLGAEESGTAELSTGESGDQQAATEETFKAAPNLPVVQIKPREPLQSAEAVPAAPQSEPAAAAQKEDEQKEAPTFDVVRVEKSGETVIAGRAEPDSEVNVKTQTGETIGKARADRSGTWAIVTETPLTPGSHEIGIESQNAEGETQLSKDVVVVMVPEPTAATGSASEAPASGGTVSAAAEQPQVLAVLTPREGSGGSKVVQEPESEDGIAAGDLVLDSVDYDEEGRVTVGGRGTPGSRMLIYLDNRLVGDTVAGPGSRWSHSPERLVAEGLHSLRVDQVDRDGTVLARVETPFSREAVRVAEATEDFVIVQPGNSLWRIARRSYGHGIRYTVIYQANQDQIRDPDLIYPGQVFEIPKTN